MDMNNTPEVAYGWDDTITADPVEWTPLPEGEYDFEVIDFKRAQYQPKPGAKLPPCNMANLEIMLHSATGTRKVQHSLFLHSKMEGKLSEFFTSIGQKKKGEPLKMNWQTVVTSRGRAKVVIDKFISNKGEELFSNKISRFLEPEANQVATQQPAIPQYNQAQTPQYNQPAMPQYQQQPTQQPTAPNQPTQPWNAGDGY